MLSKPLVQNDPVMSSLVREDRNMFTWTGQGSRKRIIVYPVDFDRQYNVVVTHPQELSDKEANGHNEEAAIGMYKPPL